MEANNPITNALESRTLHIYREGTFSKGYQVMDSDKTTALFKVEVHSMTKPTIMIYSTLPHEKGFAGAVGTITFHPMSAAVDMDVRGQAIKFLRSDFKTNGHEWRSPAFSGRVMKWKPDGFLTRNRICYLDDADGGGDGDKHNVVARWESARMAMSKLGKIHIVDPNLATPGTPEFDELVVSAIAEMEATRRQDNSGPKTVGLFAGGV